MRIKIISTCELADVPEALSLLEGMGDVLCLGDDRARVLGELADCQAYLAGGDIRIDQEFLDHAPQLRLIGSPHTGKDHMELKLIEERGIPLYHIADERELLDGFTATSELAFGLLLALIRKIPAALNSALAGVWAREYFSGFQLIGKTLGILGLGRLGTISARIGQGFGMRVIAHDICDVTAPGVDMVDFDTLFGESDVLLLHIHLTPETENIVSREALELMKKEAILINTCRGGIIDETALLDALQTGILAGAGLDVINGEWLAKEELIRHPLMAYAANHNNLLITPHIAGSTAESISGARVFMARRIVKFFGTQEAS